MGNKGTNQKNQLKVYFFVISFISVITGCSTYDPLPLNQEAYTQAVTLPSSETLTLKAAQLENPLLKTALCGEMKFDFTKGVTVDQASVLSVLVNPSLRSERNRYDIVNAQLFGVGLLPSPIADVSFNRTEVEKHHEVSSDFGAGISWEVTSLIGYAAKEASAEAQVSSVRLDIAWKEWQTATAARKAAYDVLSLREQYYKAKEIDDRLHNNFSALEHSPRVKEKNIFELTGAETASRQAHAITLALHKDLKHKEVELKSVIGIPTGEILELQADSLRPLINIPSEEEIVKSLEDRRLDLLALKRGYESQDETVWAAVLSQFPKISIGFSRARDSFNVYTRSLGVTINLPIFDGSRGLIAQEKATRQMLFDEYHARLLEAQTEVAMSLTDLRSISEQISAAQAALPSLQKLVDTYNRTEADRDADIVSYYYAQNDLYQKQLEILKLTQDFYASKVALETASGMFFHNDTLGNACQIATATNRVQIGIPDNLFD